MKASTPMTVAGLKQAAAPLLALWERQARRVDALSLRERAILFLCIAAVLAAGFDSLVLSPLNARAKLRAELASVQAKELSSLREQFVAQSRDAESDPAMQRQAALVAAQIERTRLDAALASSQAAMVAGAAEAGLPAVLQRLLAQVPGLSLSHLALLDATAPRPGEASLPGLSWQGVELRTEGGFVAQQRYLQALERQLPGLQWGELRLLSPGGQGREPAQLSAQVFVLKVQP